MSAGHVWSEHAASYVLDALDADERAAFESHLADCDTCRALVDEYREVTGMLAHGTSPVAPPASLRDRVLREAKQVRPIGSAARPDEIRAAAPSTPARPASFGRPSRAPWLAAAAAIVLALGAVYFYASERSRRDAVEQALAERAQDVLAQRTRADSLAAALVPRDSLLGTLLSPDVRTATLASTGRAPSMRLFWDPARGRMILTAFDLQPAPAGRTYQLWGIADGAQPVSLGTFNTGPSGQAAVALAFDPALRFSVSAVTEEPTGGSPQPTTQPFLVGTFRSD
jgi:anti-sigma-K factor RskA